MNCRREHRHVNRGSVQGSLGIAGLAFILNALAASAAPANPTGVVAGRLTCTAEAKPAGEKLAPRDLSCRLQRVSGRPATYTGLVTRYGRDALARGKLVLTWTVLAPRAHVEPGALAGRYRSTSRSTLSPPGSRGGRSLVGGSNGTIILRPLAGSLAAADRSIRELELTLAATRT